jgi:integrase/recombinase XerD
LKKRRPVRERKPLHPYLTAILRMHLGRVRGVWLFPSPQDSREHITANGVQKAWAVLVGMAEITGEPILRHTLRHTFATKLAERSVDLGAISRLLSHGSLAQSEDYVHASVESLRTHLQALPVPDLRQLG